VEDSTLSQTLIVNFARQAKKADQAPTKKERRNGTLCPPDLPTILSTGLSLNFFSVRSRKYGEQCAPRGEKRTNRLQSSAVWSSKITYLVSLPFAHTVRLFTVRSIRYHWGFVSLCSAIITYILGSKLLAISLLFKPLAYFVWFV
jgi:hypothetical protein